MSTCFIRFGLKSKEAAEDRQLPEMPLHFKNCRGELLRYNLRKLGELTFHLARAGRTEDLVSHCLFNYDWVYAKVTLMLTLTTSFTSFTSFTSLSSCVRPPWPPSWQTTQTLSDSAAQPRSNK